MSEYPSYLIHYGVQGQKWGNRRYQNEDGSLTPEGREHYGIKERDIRKIDSGKTSIHDYVSKNKYIRKSLDRSEARREFVRVNKKHRDLVRSIEEERDRRAQVARQKLDPDSEKKIYTSKLDEKVWQAGAFAAGKYVHSPKIQKILKQDEKEWKSAYENYKKDAERIINEVLGDYGKHGALPNSKRRGYEAAEHVVNQDIYSTKDISYTKQRKESAKEVRRQKRQIMLAKIM